MTTQQFARLLQWGIALTFIAPLIVLPNSFIFPFIVPKVLLFRSIIAIVFGGYCVLLLADWESYRPRLGPTTIAVALFFLSWAISTVTGVNWYRSMWDNHERMLGLFSVAHYLLLFFIVANIMKKEYEWRQLFRLFLISGAITMVIGMMQKVIDPQLLLNNNAARPSGTLGNPIYYSGYGLFLLMLGSLTALKETYRSAWWWGAVSVAVLGFLGIFVGATRGTVLGLALGLVVLLTTLLVLRWDQHKVRYSILGAFVLGLIVVGGLFAYRDTGFVQSLPAINRIVTLTPASLATNTRIMAWGIAVEAWQERPLFGWGPNNFYVAFNKYYRPEFLRYGFNETWFDNAHSAIFNTIAVQGLFGLLTYLALFVVPAAVAIKAYKTSTIGERELAIILAFLGAHFGHNATVFENPTSYLYFFFFLAYVAWRVSPARSHGSQDVALTHPLRIAIVVVMLLFVYSTNINPARANSKTLHMIIALQQTPGAGIAAYQQAVAIPTPHIDDVRNDFARNTALAVSQAAQQIGAEDTVALLDAAIEAQEQNLALHPDDIRYYLVLSQLHNARGVLQNNQIDLLRSGQDLEQAIALSPRRQQLLFTLAILKTQFQEWDEAERLIQQAIDEDPTIGEGWARLITLALQQEDEDRAYALVQEARGYNVNFRSYGAYIDEFARQYESSTLVE